MVAVGAVVGAPLAWVASRAATTLIGGAGVNAPASIVVAGVLLLLAAVAATIPPAMRASSIDPLDALRQD
jgi:ABC-type antimicrobial peptide transport system permease subunit